MIYTRIKEALETIPALKDKVFPAGVVIDEVETPLAVYICQSAIPYKTLNGRTHHYTEVVAVDILSETYDECHALYEAVEAAVEPMAEDPSILSIRTESTEADASLPELGLVRRTAMITVEFIRR